MLTDLEFSNLCRVINNAERYQYFVLAVFKHKQSGKVYYLRQSEAKGKPKLYYLSPSDYPSLVSPKLEQLYRINVLPDEDFDADSELKRIFS